MWDTILRGMTNQEEGTLEWLVEDELRGQKILASLPQESWNKHAKKIFHKVFYVHQGEIGLENGNGASSLN